MKVLLLHNRYQQRGGEDSVFDDESELLARNMDVVHHVVDNRDLVPGVGAALAAVRLPWSRAAYRKIQAVVRRERPDVAHFHNIFPQITVSGYDACRDLGVPVVQTLHNFRIWCACATFFRNGAVCEECVSHGPGRAVQYRCYRNSRLGSWAVARMQRSTFLRNVWQSRVDRFIALSPFARAKAVSLGLPADKTLLKPNFCHRPVVRRLAPGQSALFVGRLSPEKGLATVIRAFLSEPAWRLRIAGTGPEENALRTMAQSSPQVEFLGGVDRTRVAQLMLESSFLVVPSVWYEMFPRVVVEAFSVGLPVVASRIGSLPDIVRDRHSGLLFEPGSEADLRRCSRQLFESEATNHALGHNAMQQYETEYSPEACISSLSRIYTSLRL